MTEETKQQNDTTFFEDFEEFAEGNLEQLEEINFEEAQHHSRTYHIGLWKQKSIVQLLRVIAIISKYNVDLISRSIRMERDNDSIVLQCTDKDCYLEARLPLRNEDLRYDGSPILDSRQLIEVVKNFLDLILYSMENQMFCNLLGGHSTLENYSFDSEIYKVVDPTIAGVTTSAKDLLEEVTHLLSLLALAGRPEDKRVIISEGMAYGQFLNTLTQSKTSLPNLALRQRDLEILKVLLSLYITEAVDVHVENNRVYFSATNFRISFTAITSDLHKDIQAKFTPNSGDYYINGSSASKILKFLASPVMKVSKVVLVAGESGLKFILSSQKGVKSEFLVTETPSPVEFESELNIALAKKVFSVVSSFSSVSLSRVEENLFLQTDSFCLIMPVR